jgi:HEAT repeat protein
MSYPDSTPEIERQEIEQAIQQLTTGDFHSRWDSAKRFAEQFAQWGDRPVPILISHLKSSSDPDAQWFLTRALGYYDQPAAVEAIAHLLSTTAAEDLQMEAIKALTQLGDRAIAPLSNLLTADQPRRLLAARALAQIRRSATIDPLLSVAADRDPQLRAIALEALGSFHDPRITPVLLAALTDISPICIEAIRTLGRRHDLLTSTDLIGPLQRCLRASDGAVAQESAVALGRLGGEAAAQALATVLAEPTAAPVKMAIARALGWLNLPEAVMALTSAFEQDAPIVMPTLRQEIARSLGQTRAPALRDLAIQPLLKWIQSPAEMASHERIATTQSVIEAIARLGSPAAADSLIALLSDRDSRIRLHALSALKQIDPQLAPVKIQRYLQNEQIAPHLRECASETFAAW